MKRVIVIVMDGCGAGAAPDAPEFGDTLESATVRHVWEAVGGFTAPALRDCGLLHACGVPIPPEGRELDVRYGRLRPLSKGGKDSVTGHWEMMGIVMDHAFPTYPNGFPAEVVQAFQSSIGRSVLGNVSASGTQIIADLGAEHMRTGQPIIYTSADSVFQIAAHEEVVPIETLYAWCDSARKISDVQRVIARPFVGEPGAFVRTEKRRDFPLPPPHNLVDEITDVYGIGVVPELFVHRGFRLVPRTQSNPEHERALEEALTSDARLIFANFEDFDMLFGHRNDPAGFARCLATFDEYLSGLLQLLAAEDLLILTADHGNDPTDVSTDHTREFVPACIIKKASDAKSKALNFGDVPGFTAIGATVAAHLEMEWPIGRPLNV
jgi:phosphopentomutase